MRYHQIRQRGSQANRVIEFAQRLLERVPHRLAEIHHQKAGQVRFGFVLANVILVGFREHAPIDVVRVVTGRVLPVLAELNTKAVERAGVQTMQKASHDELSSQIKPLDLVDDFGLEVFFDRHKVRGFRQTDYGLIFLSVTEFPI